MSKIVKAINAMISQKDRISHVVLGHSENTFFFLYSKKHKWSIHKDLNDIFTINYYTGGELIDYLANVRDEEWQEIENIMRYIESDLGSREDQESLSELFMLLNEKLLGMDVILDDIISDDIPF
ncbi:MAG: hypothetical protein COA79_22670 [Planctomycetota bacterium]|nr:MAG: hypothetical protein COA79_22670 [Planctomycetota bacterium]